MSKADGERREYTERIRALIEAQPYRGKTSQQFGSE